MKITYLAHACFRIESKGYAIVIDPYEDGSVPGCGPIREQADQVLCSHGHHDHNAADCVTLRKGETSPFRVEVIDTWHDDQEGALRGANRIHILDDGECRLAHLGDLGCRLTPDQLEKLRGVTALLIPVGGHFTIDAGQAHTLAEELAPTVTIPMHYRTENFGFDVIGTLEEFTRLRGNVVEYPGGELELAPGLDRQTAVLTPQMMEKW